MDYRDDRDALKARMESLEGELATARAEVERMRATENALTAAQRENEKLRAEVRRLTPKPKPARSPKAAAVVAGASIALVASAGAVFVAMIGRPAPAPPITVVEPAANPVAEGPTPAAQPEQSPRAATVEWPARVTKAEGLSYPPGSACTVRATLRTDGQRAVGSPEVEIACAGKWLYRSTDQLSGISNHSFELEEVPGAEQGSQRAVLSWVDTGSRTGERTQASVSTFDHVAVAWKETAPAYRVELAVEEMSTAWKGPALFTEHEGKDPPVRAFLQRAARVVEVKDNPLVAKGEACSVEVRPSWQPDNPCRVRVHCGATTLYGLGSAGYTKCAAEGTSLLNASDDKTSDADKDPAVALDAPKGTVQVTDTTPAPWSVKLQLDPPAR